MNSIRKSALAAGVLYLITFAASIPAVILLHPVLSNPNYIVSVGADTQVTAGAFLDLVNALACIGTAVALFPVVRRVNETLALGFVASRVYEAAVIMIGVVSILAVVALRQAGTTGADPSALIAVGRGLVAVRNATFLLGPGLVPAINALLLGTLLYRSRLVPRVIPSLALIGAPLLLSATIGTMFGVNQSVSAWTGIATLPIFLWELSVGLWMTFKGFRVSTSATDAPVMATNAVAA
ncbi:MAG: DUF4386 domain-containing protein [Candidatus Limnocylindrales bacterium]